MPWFPDFISAAELARRQTRAAGQADPVAQYITALNKGDIHALQTVWPGEMVVYDPRAGEIRGRKQLRRFVSQNQSWLADAGHVYQLLLGTPEAAKATGQTGKFLRARVR